jgi:DNA-binding MarR family transcriptional regulator
VVSDKPLSTNEQKILDFLLAHPSSTNKGISEGLEMDRSNVSKYIKKLEARTLVYVQNGAVNVVH